MASTQDQDDVDGGGSDCEFELTAEMMVDDYDDEQTLDDELEDAEEIADEVNELEKEGDMPLEDLLRMYGYGNVEQGVDNTVTDSGPSNPATSLENVSEDKRQPLTSAVHLLPDVNNDDVNSVLSDASNSVDSHGQSTYPQDDQYDPFHNQRITRGLAALNSQYFDESSSDDEYQPYSENWKKEVQIGMDYQAEVPLSLSTEPMADDIDLHDKLLWKPDVIEARQLQSALHRILQSSGQDVGNCDRDDEQALYALLLTGGNVDVALKNSKGNSTEDSPRVSLWSEEECKQFEQGLKVYGKNFRLVQQNKVASRTVGEIVQFYYLWKKTERHDLFVMQSRLGKRKYGLPGVADYMDRFMDENESVVSSRAVSPCPIGKRSDDIENNDANEINNLEPLAKRAMQSLEVIANERNNSEDKTLSNDGENHNTKTLLIGNNTSELNPQQKHTNTEQTAYDITAPVNRPSGGAFPIATSTY